jgi:hypothetical protein
VEVVNMLEIVTNALCSEIGIPLTDDKISRSASGNVIDNLALHDVLMVGPSGVDLREGLRIILGAPLT